MSDDIYPEYGFAVLLSPKTPFAEEALNKDGNLFGVIKAGEIEGQDGRMESAVVLNSVESKRSCSLSY